MNLLAILALAVLSLMYVIAHQKYVINRALKILENRPSLSHQEFSDEFYPEPMRDIAARVREILSHHLPYDITQTCPSDRMNVDLRMDDLDSMSNVECLIELEQEFKIEISDPEAQDLVTIDDLIRCVSRKMKVRVE